MPGTVGYGSPLPAAKPIRAVPVVRSELVDDAVSPGRVNPKGKVLYEDDDDLPYVMADIAKAPAVNLPLMLRRALKKQGASTYAVSKETGIAMSALSRFKSGKGDLSLKNAGKLMGVVGLKVKKAYMSRRVWVATEPGCDGRQRHELAEPPPAY
jgi:hypothetical protein